MSRHIRIPLPREISIVHQSPEEDPQPDKVDYVWSEKVALLEEAYLELESELSRLRAAAPQWRPIEEAPKDGTEVDLCVWTALLGGYWRIPDCRWSAGRWEHLAAGHEEPIPVSIDRIDFYMPKPPLPPAPAKEVLP